MKLSGQCGVDVAAPPLRVWQLVADIERMGEWSPENQGGEWIPPATAAMVGARFRGRNRRGKYRWTTVAEVEVAEPGRIFAFRVGNRKPSVWTYTIVPTEDGCRVIEQFDIPKYTWFDALTTRLTLKVDDRQTDLVAGCRHTLAQLKCAAECR